MTLHAVVDDEDCGQVATTQGWSDLFDWADAQGYFELAHLVRHGYATRLKVLAKEINAAIAKSNPSEDIVATARGIEEIARSRPKGKILIVTDGTGYAEDDEEIDDDGDEDDEDDDDDFSDLE